MKRLVYFMLLLMAFAAFSVLLSGCGKCSHRVEDAVEENRVEPTCTADGKYDKVYYCPDCGDELSRDTVSIDKTGHDVVATEAVSADCTNDGVGQGEVCRVCDAVITEPEKIPAMGHDEVSHEAKAPTCTEGGYDAYVTCSRCNHTTYSEKAATGHTETVIERIEPTCTASGSTEGKYCSVCEEILVPTIEISVLPHTYDDVYDESCNVCGFIRDAECAHLETEVIAGTAATCVAPGLTDGAKCKKCKEVLTAQEEIPAMGHEEIPHEAKAPTCTEGGYDAYVTCARCDYTTYSEKAAAGHTEVTVDGKDASCTEDGLTAGVYCSVCNEVLTAQTVIPATGHVHNDSDNKCDVCGKEYFTISYVLNGGVNSEENITVYSSDDSAFRFKNPTREGYEFHGWYTDASFKNHIASLNGRSGNLVLYAKWVQKSSGGIITPEQPLN